MDGSEPAPGAPRPATDAGAPTRGGRNRTALLGAIFLMATSAIGPGFIVQTTAFTVQLGAAFAFAILISVLVDIAVQLNVWRVIGVSGRRAHELANALVPGLGWVLAALLLMGGLVFNIGNIAGTGLGLDAMLGLDTDVGAVISVVLAVGIFLSKRAGVAMDRVVIVLGAVMILLTGYVAVSTGPPVLDALRSTVAPDEVSFLVITTLIGGTVGGYITYAGAHRLLDSGQTGPDHATEVARASVVGILTTAAMRAILFLAVLGVVAGGAVLDPDNQAASAFEQAAGQFGLRAFGVIFWAAAITSVIGASYTTVSFLTTSRTKPRTQSLLTVAFIVVCLVSFLWLQKAPATLLIFAGGFNGLILPLGFTVVLYVAWRRRDLLQGYGYPRWLLLIGILAWLLTLWLGWESLSGLQKLWA